MLGRSERLQTDCLKLHGSRGGFSEK